MSRVAFVDGRYVPFAQAAVHVEDRGLQFADSIYEVFAAQDGRLLDEDGHWRRLERSLGELRQGMPMPRAALAVHAKELLRRNRVADGLVYLQVTRGVAKRDHPFPPPGLAQTVIMTVRRRDPARADALAVQGIAVKTERDIRWGRRDIKTTALVANVLAKQSAREAGAYEAWLVDDDGLVTEGASTNAWIVTHDGSLITRQLSQDILPGITREAVTALARDRQMTLVERPFTVDEAMQASEAFITSAGTFVLAVVKIDGREIGQGRPGPVSTTLRQAYLSRASSD